MDIDILLKRWGVYIRSLKSVTDTLGFPQYDLVWRSVFAGSRPHAPDNPEIDRLDTYINSLPLYLKKVIIGKYVVGNATKTFKKMGISEPTFYSYLKRAKGILQAKMERS